MKHLLLIISLLFAQDTVFGQIDQYYGGCGAEYAVDFYISNDQFNILGTSNSFDWSNPYSGSPTPLGLDGDIYQFKVDTSGNTLFAKTYRIDDLDELPKGILNWNNNLSIVFGRPNQAPYLIANDSLGQILWSVKTNSSINDACISKSNQLVVCGYDPLVDAPYVSSLDSTGNFLVSNHYNYSSGDGNFAGIQIIEDVDSNFVMFGSGNYQPANEPAGQSVFFLMKLDNNFNVVWTKVWDIWLMGGGEFVHTHNNENLIVGKKSQNIFILKTDSSGEIDWVKEIIYDDYVEDVIETTNGEYLILTQNSTLIKLDQWGNVIWVNQYDPTIDSFLYSAVKIQEYDNKYYLLKTSTSNPLSDSLSPLGYKSDILIVKIDTSGTSSIGQTSFNFVSNSVIVDTISTAFTRTTNNLQIDTISFIENAVSSTFSDSSDCISVSQYEHKSLNYNTKVYPNPSYGSVTIELGEVKHNRITIEVSDLQGKVILERDLLNDQNKIFIDIPQEIKGLLFVKIHCGEFIRVHKLDCL